MKYFYLKLKSLLAWTEEARLINNYEQYIFFRKEEQRLLAGLDKRFPETNKTQTRPFQVLPYNRKKGDNIVTVDTLNLH